MNLGGGLWGVLCVPEEGLYVQEYEFKAIKTGGEMNSVSDVTEYKIPFFLKLILEP